MPPATLQAKQLTLGFNETEDRLVLLARDDQGQAALLGMTRRLTGRLINGLAAVLERSNREASKAPLEVRNDIVLMEHQGALTGLDQDPARNPDQPRPADSPLEPPRIIAPLSLVSSINLHVMPEEFQLTFHVSGGVSVGLAVGRHDLHRVLGLLKRKAEAAEWNIIFGVSWLEPGQHSLVLN